MNLEKNSQVKVELNGGEQKNINCLLCGIGGQGTVLASRLIALSALEKGLDAKTAETIGMAQRGGSVVSHVRIGENIHSPLIPMGKADILIALEPGEGLRQLGFLKEGGHLILSNKGITPVTAALSQDGYDSHQVVAYLKEKVENITVVDSDKIMEALGTVKPLNVVLLGQAEKTGLLGLTEEDLMDTIERIVPEKYRELNKKALKGDFLNS